MSVIKSVKDFFAKKKDKSLNTTELFGSADMTADALGTIMDAIHNEAFAADMIETLTAVESNSRQHAYLSGAAYAEMIKVLPSVWKQHEIKSPLICLEAIIGTLIHDLRDIMSNYRAYFADETLKDEDLRISNLVITGYIEAAERFTSWLQWIILVQSSYSRTGMKINQSGPAKYIVKSIELALPTVKQLASEILSRKRGTTFMSILSALRESNNDVAVSQDGVDITVYAEDSSFSRVELQYTQMGLSNPFIMLGKVVSLYKKTMYEKQRSLREWISMRIVQLEQERNGLDPQSSEYQKIEHVLTKYLDQISHLDAKIKQYEVQH